MNALNKVATHVVGLNVPAAIGTPLEDVHTPALIVDLDAFERNVKRMGEFAKKMGVRHRAHAKTHKSADIARIQAPIGLDIGAVSPAEIAVAIMAQITEKLREEADAEPAIKAAS